MLPDNQDIANSVYTKIYLDLLSNCYDKITEREAEAYERYTDPREVKCNSNHIDGLLNFIPSNYEGISEEEQIQPTMQQLILVSALKVNKGVINRKCRNDVRRKIEWKEKLVKVKALYLAMT